MTQNSTTPSATTPGASSPTFAQLGVSQAIRDALEQRGIAEPFQIQAATIADSMAGRDVCGRAPTGSGKTLAFGIPLVSNVAKAKPKRPSALVLAPTRELAEQIHTEIRSFSGRVRVGVVYGGVGYGPQLKMLRQGVEILVACPGRLEDLIDRGDVALNNVEHVVLDEADRMADMGFMPSVRRLLDQTRSERQTVLFSATLDGDVAKLTRDYQNNPVRHEVGEETPDITAASHVFWTVDRAERVSVTADAVNAVWPAIVFCRTRHGSDRLAKQLTRAGVGAAAIHGGRSQGQRTRALENFARGKVQALVATDVAARGIHVDGVASVVHFDPPEDHKAYVHRSGRTARAGEGGVVVSLLMADQVKDARSMQRKIGLEEPITDSDAGALRELSPAPTKPKPAPQPAGKTQSSGSKAQRNGRKGQANGPRGKHKRPKAKPKGPRAQSDGRKVQRNGSNAQSNGPGSEAAGANKSNAPGQPASKRPNRRARRAHLQRNPDA